jgi:hypothetical protein
MTLRVVTDKATPDERTLENVIASQEKLQEAVELLTQAMVAMDARLARLEQGAKKKPPAILNRLGERAN